MSLFRKIYSCPECKKSFITPYNLKRHTKENCKLLRLRNSIGNDEEEDKEEDNDGGSEGEVENNNNNNNKEKKNKK